MYNRIRSLLLLAMGAGFSTSSIAQTDSLPSSFNLGRVTLQKDFTQAITIKGEQLERMPFTNLTEALAAWLYGTYSNNATLVYVIDGMLANDVNAYSVYDIEEVSLIQNALVQVNGANRQQQLVVIKTRKGGVAKQGLMVAGQSFLVQPQMPPKYLGAENKTSSAFYHQYQLSAYQRRNNIQYGLSANYQRDVLPLFKDPGLDVHIPTNLHRFRFNGWVTAQLGKAHDLTLAFNYAPQTSRADYTRLYTGPGTYVQTHSTTADDKLYSLYPSLRLRSRFFKGFTNELGASYLKSKITDDFNSRVNNPQPPPSIANSQNLYKETIQNVVISDQLNYLLALGDWHIDPAFNFQFRYVKYDESQQVRTSNSSVPGFNLITNASWAEYRSYLLTPSVNVYYKNIFNLQGGLLANASKGIPDRIKKTFPFGSMSLDVLKLVDQQQRHSLRIFGSYAATYPVGDLSYKMDDFSSNLGTKDYVPSFAFGSTLNPMVYNIGRDSTYWIWQAGASFRLAGDRLGIDYNFERRNYSTEVLTQAAAGPGSFYIILLPGITSSTHHIRITSQVLATKDFNWFTGVTVTSIKNKSTLDNPQQFTYTYNGVGDFDSDKTSWTGGWVNRFTWKRLTAGTNLLYDLRQQRIFNSYSKANIVALQNAYVGYKLSVLKKVKDLEVYADCRNIAQHDRVRLETRKYWGLGFKATL